MSSLEHNSPYKITLPKSKKVGILLSIPHSGIRIPKDIIDKLGEPYISKNNNGMGLGIFISKNLIENTGGKISFYNSKENCAVVESERKYISTRRGRSKIQHWCSDCAGQTGTDDDFEQIE